MTHNRADCVRIFLHDPGEIRFVTEKRRRQTLKMEKFKYLIKNHYRDLVGLADVNKNWRNIEYENTI